MQLRFLIFFVVLLALLGAINLFVHRRVSHGLGLTRRGRRWFGAILAVGLAAMILGRLVARPLPDVAVALGTSSAVVQLGALVAFAILAIERLIHGTGRGARWLRRRLHLGEAGGSSPAGATSAAREASAEAATAREASAEAEMAREASAEAETAREASAEAEMAREASPAGAAALAGAAGAVALPRRTFLEAAAATGAVVLGGGSSLYGTLYGRHDYAIEEIPISLEKLPPALDGFTIAQLSDVHFGAFVGERELAAGVDLVRSIRPNIVVLTGDLVDHDPRYAAMLGRFARRLGEVAPVFAIPGNHDHYAGLEETLGELRRGGAEVLVNRHRRVGEGRIVLAGVDDVWGARVRRGPDLARALEGAPADLPRVLLCHNPVFFPEAADRVDLQLSGHTHGGQFNPGVRVADLVLPFGYVAGRYERGASQLYVNRGFGTAGPPARIGAPPEITKIVLTV